MSIYRSVIKHRNYLLNSAPTAAILDPTGKNNSKPLIGLSKNRYENILIWTIGIVVTIGIIILNTSFHQRDLTATVVYFTLLLMAANVFSIRVVIGVSLFCMGMIVVLFFTDAGYSDWDSTTGFVRCLTALSAIAFLAMRGKRAADSLRHNEVYLTGAQRLSQTGSVGFRGTSDEMSWSEECARIFEYPADQPPSRPMILARTHPEDLSFVHEVFERAARHEAQIEIRHRLLMPDGRVKHIHMIATPLFTQDDRFEYLGALMDVTERKQAEETLFRTQAQLAHIARVTTLGELAASIAHEVNQPLTAINSSADACRRWLDRPEPDMAEALGALERIKQSATRSGEVINRVRALSRKSDPVRKPEPFNDLVSETLCLVQHEMTHHEITARIEFSPCAPSVCADRVQLQQVIINLVINACQAMADVQKPQRVLHIRTCVKEGEAVLEVIDCGPGISDEVLPSLFNPFFTTKAAGLGMGLSICRSIIEFHGGRLWASSDKSGATFCFALPVSEGGRA